MDKPSIRLLSLGGTITMTRTADGTISPNLTAADLVAAVPGIETYAKIATESPFKLPGGSLTFDHLVSIAALIDQRFSDDVDGVVVIQGTDTIEETAFVLDLLVRSDKPVVVTGAMRGAEMPGADGPANILAATLVAGSVAAKGLGALAVLNDEIHAARFVQKSHTGAPSAFTSPSAGPLGIVSENKVRVQMRIARTPPLPKALGRKDAAVALAMIGLGDDGRLLKALPGLGFQGAVIAAMGAGHVPMTHAPLLEDLARQMPVVLATRVPAGPTFTATYGFQGSESDLLSRGLISSGNLSAVKARLLLALLLMGGADRTEIAREFDIRGN